MLMSTHPRVRQALAALVFVSAVAPAQTGRIAGTVTGAGSMPLVGAHVLLGAAGLSAESGDSGRFTMRSVPAGKHDLRVYAVGYKPQNVTGIAVGAGQEATIAVTLERAAVQLGGVVIAATRRLEKITDAPATVTALDTSDLSGTIGNSYVPALKAVNGLEFIQTGVLSVAVNARGFNSVSNRRVLYMEDGRIAVLPENGAPVGPLTTIPKADLAAVEVLVGPGSALYGPDAANGVLLLSTKDPKRYPGWVAEVSGGSRDFYDAQLRYAGVRGHWGYKVAGEYQAANDWTNVVYYPAVTAGGAPIRERDPDFRTDVARGSGALAWYFDNGDRFQLTAGASKRNALGSNANSRTQLSNYVYRDFQLQYTGPRWFAQAYETNSNGNTVQLGPFSQNAVKFPTLSIDSVRKLASQPLDGRLYAAEVQNNFSVGMLGMTGMALIDNTHVVWGTQFRHDRVSSYLHVLSDRVTGQAIEIEQKGAYAQVETPIGAMFSTVIAARLDKHDRYETQFSPKAGILFTPVQDQTVRLTYNRAFAAPFMQQTDAYNPNLSPNTGLFGNVDGFDIKNAAGTVVRTIAPVKPETNGTWELGYKGVIAGRLYVDLTGYQLTFKDFISPALPIANPFTGATATTAYNHKTGQKITDERGNPQTVRSFFNVGKVAITGVDVGLRYYLTDRIVASGTVSLIKLDTIERKATDPIDATALNSSSSRITAGMEFKDLPGGAGGGFTARYVNGYDFLFGVFAGRIPPYGTLDLNASYRIRGTRATATLQVRNLFACVGGTSTPPAAGIAADVMATYAPGQKCGFGQPHQEFLNTPLMGSMGFVGVRWEGR